MSRRLSIWWLVSASRPWHWSAPIASVHDRAPRSILPPQVKQVIRPPGRLEGAAGCRGEVRLLHRMHLDWLGQDLTFVGSPTIAKYWARKATGLAPLSMCFWGDQGYCMLKLVPSPGLHGQSRTLTSHAVELVKGGVILNLIGASRRGRGWDPIGMPALGTGKATTNHG